MFNFRGLSILILVVFPSLISLIGIFTFIEYFLIVGPVYLAISILFGISPIWSNLPLYIVKGENYNILNAYQLIKTIVYFEIPIVLVITIFTFFYLTFNPSASPIPIFFIKGTPSGSNQPDDPAYGLLAPINTFVYSTIAGVLWITIQNKKKDFRLNFAKAYIKLIRDSKDRSNNVFYLVRALRSYDKYLRQSLNLQINTEAIYSKIICRPDLDLDKTIVEITRSFESKLDKLEPIRVISKLVNNPETKILVETTIWERIKDMAGFLSGVTATLLSIFQYVLPPLLPK